MENYKIIRILLLMFFILFIISSRCFALGDWIQQAEDFMDVGASKAGATSGQGDTMDTSALASGSSIIFNALFAVGTVIAVIVGAILGVQFMTAGIDKKVEVKQALYPYLISCIVLFGSYGIWRLVIIIMNNI